MKDKSQHASSMGRRQFLQLSAVAVSAVGAAGPSSVASAAKDSRTNTEKKLRRSQGPDFIGCYSGDRINRVAFPLGGIGAGMICLEGTGALSHFSLRNRPDVFNEPLTFAAICLKGSPNSARVLEGPVPDWKKFGSRGAGNGSAGTSFGLPRFREASFRARFPFGTVMLNDTIPLGVEVTGWSPFEPGDADVSSLPVAGLEYRFTNKCNYQQEAVFSWHARNFMEVRDGINSVDATPGGFILSGATKGQSREQAQFSAVVDDPQVKVNHAWFRGGWFDSITMVWKDVESGNCQDIPPVTSGDASSGASLFVPFTLAPQASKTIVLRLAWYVGQSKLHFGLASNDARRSTHKPWYAEKFPNLGGVTSYWSDQYSKLRERTQRFSDCFYDSTLPPEVLDAVAANLTILKSPTVLRQADGRLWAWEGCGDDSGCCAGSCTHVWNYAQALPHLFPTLERTLRETEFGPSQDERGHQQFRSALPIGPVAHDFHAAADGQLGGVMKVYRDWRISGDSEWLRHLWPKVQTSLNYCIELWDPGRKGWLEEPHHNTYDIEFWGPDSMCTSFYLGALKAASLMGQALQENVSNYDDLLNKGRARMEEELFNGEYFVQKVAWKSLRAKNPVELQSMVGDYSAEARELLEREGPKYQYGQGCLADGIIGAWMATMCGVGRVLDPQKVTGHLKSVHKYNLKPDLTEHANPQRPSYACGAEGGLLLCTWPKGGELSLPFVYSNEVWTGVEYQVASHLMSMGLMDEGLEIVRTARDRYDGRTRNPFNEYECGHWYARAMSSYALLQGITGARYDAVDKILYLEPKIKGDFRSFFSTAFGYGTVGIKNGTPFYVPKTGALEIREIRYLAASTTRA